MKISAKLIFLYILLLTASVSVAVIIHNPLGILIVVLAIVVIGASCFIAMQQSSDPLDELRGNRKYMMFSDQIEHLAKNKAAVEMWGSNAQSYVDASSVSKSYELISRQMNNIIASAVKYIKTYDYVSRPRAQYLGKLICQSDELVKKLHELQELILKVDDSTSDVDISYVDDLLSALRDMGE